MPSHIKAREDCWDDSRKFLIPQTKFETKAIEPIESLKQNK